MRDVAGDLLQIFEQDRDAVQHFVDGARQAIPFIAAARSGMRSFRVPAMTRSQVWVMASTRAMNRRPRNKPASMAKAQVPRVDPPEGVQDAFAGCATWRGISSDEQ